MANSAFAAPYVGLCLLALLFPFVHSKGAGAATLLVAVYQIVHVVKTINSGKRPPRLEVSLEYCPGNLTAKFLQTNSSQSGSLDLKTESQEVLFLFRLSYFWTSFFAILATLLLGVLLSALTGEVRREAEQPHLTSDIITRTWRRCLGSPIKDNHKVKCLGVYRLHHCE